MSEQYVPDLPTNDALNAAADRRVWAYDAPGATDEQLAEADSAFVNEVHIAILQSEWLAAHDREVKAEALREAAAELGSLIDSQHPAAVNPDHWLTDRADRIESEARP